MKPLNLIHLIIQPNIFESEPGGKEFGRETLKYFNAGYEYYLNGEYEKAIEAFNKSLEMNAEFEKARKISLTFIFSIGPDG